MVTRLFQEGLRLTPFWMLVACSLVNLTTWTQAKPALLSLGRTYGRASALATARPEDLHSTLRPLGLWRRRSSLLIRLASEWDRLRDGPHAFSRQKIGRLPGCGRYAMDSWSIFREDDLGVSPTDGKLIWYLDEVRSGRRRHLSLEEARHEAARTVA